MVQAPQGGQRLEWFKILRCVKKHAWWPNYKWNRTALSPHFRCKVGTKRDEAKGTACLSLRQTFLDFKNWREKSSHRVHQKVDKIHQTEWKKVSHPIYSVFFPIYFNYFIAEALTIKSGIFLHFFFYRNILLLIFLTVFLKQKLS